VSVKYSDTLNFLRIPQLCCYSRTFQRFMEPEGSLPCSQEPSTGAYPEAGKLSPYHPNPTSLNTFLCYWPTYFLAFLVAYFRPAFHICMPLCLYSCYMPCPSHSPWLNHSNYTWRQIQVMKLLIMQLFPTYNYIILFSPNTLLSILISNTLSLYSFLTVRDQ
jgi:hypothetical protein